MINGYRDDEKEPAMWSRKANQTDGNIQGPCVVKALSP